MAGPVFGKLERVDPREVWDSIAGELKPWLVSEESLAQLGEATKLELEPESESGQGDSGGAVRCRDKASGNVVLIDSQTSAEETTKLGEMLTSAVGSSGLITIVVGAEVSEQDRAMLEWMNEITRPNFRFFGVELELWRIGESNFAPNFKVVCGPAKKVSSVDLPADDLDDDQRLMLEYWGAFLEVLKADNAPYKGIKPPPASAMAFPAGRDSFLFTTFADLSGQRVGVYLQVSGEKAKSYLKDLHERKGEIESNIGTNLEWRQLPDRDEGYIMQRWEGVDPNNRGKWQEQHEWLRDTLHDYHRIFQPIIKDLDADKTLYHELPWE